MKKLSIVVIVVIASWSFANAQEPQKPTVSQAADTKVSYLLEVYITPKLEPTYSLVQGAKYENGSEYYSRFIRTGEQPQSGKLPIIAVKFQSHVIGEAAELRVSVMRGVDSYDEEELVHVYPLALGEQQQLTHLRRFGIEPFLVRLLNTTPPVPPEPTLLNFTKSLEFVRVRRHSKPMPAYWIRLRNRSEKSVSALRLDVTSDGQEGPAALPDSDAGRPFIEPGGEAEVYIPVVIAVKNGTTYVPGTANSYTINIRSVTFTDLSFEGEQEQRCSVQSLEMGERVWLKVLLPFLDQEIAKSGSSDQLDAAKQFQTRVSALRYTLDEAEQDKASSVSATCPKLARHAISAANQRSQQLVREVDRFIEEKLSPSTTFKSWLEEKRASYAAWLARLR
jgi:hypothetical protein